MRPAGDPDAALRIHRELRLPRPLCRLLVARGLADPDAARRHLRPELDHLHPPVRLTQADRAADRLAAAIRRSETVLVHGDYDVDGTVATALYVRWIRRLGGRAVPFIPNRLRDGYDLGAAGLEAARSEGAAVILTADCGISAHAAVREARDAGIDVIVTDHHTPAETLPDAVAVVNPRRGDCAYPEEGLAGAGVAWKLCLLLAARFGVDQEELLDSLDLVALATVADLVPLAGENRVLARLGLRVLARSRRPGLQALMAEADVDPGRVDAGSVGFLLAPRLNAAGRLGRPEAALDLLLADDPARAGTLARRLEELNRRRQEVDRSTLAEALDRLGDRYDPEGDYGVVLEGEGWHPGVIGIVASRVVERIHRPTVLVAVDGDRGRGSARSIRGVDLFQAIQGCSEHLERFGGHPQAAGLDIRADRIADFRDSFNRRVREALGGRRPRPSVRADLELPLGQAEGDFFRYLRYLGPFGVGNPRPVFIARGVRADGRAREVGSGHLKLRLTDGEASVEAIGFGMTERLPPDRVDGGAWDALFQLRENEYRGRRTMQARLLDLRPSGGGSSGSRGSGGEPSGAGPLDGRG